MEPGCPGAGSGSSATESSNGFHVKPGTAPSAFDQRVGTTRSGVQPRRTAVGGDGPRSATPPRPPPVLVGGHRSSVRVRHGAGCCAAPPARRTTASRRIGEGDVHRRGDRPRTRGGARVGARGSRSRGRASLPRHDRWSRGRGHGRDTGVRGARAPSTDGQEPNDAPVRCETCGAGPAPPQPPGLRRDARPFGAKPTALDLRAPARRSRRQTDGPGRRRPQSGPARPVSSRRLQSRASRAASHRPVHGVRTGSTSPRGRLPRPRARSHRDVRTGEA